MTRQLVKPKETEAKLYPAVPVDWLWMPKPVRLVVGWVTIVLFALSFFSLLFAMLLLIPAVWRNYPVLAGSFAVSMAVSYALPMREWVQFRKVGQLWYEIFQFSCNMSPEMVQYTLDYCDDHQLILAMHPHGIVPFQAILWTAYCHQYFSTKDKTMYGFGAMADIVMYLPFLRNILGFLAGGSATYKVLKDGIAHGKVPCVNAAGRIPRNLYVLPGGIAEIFTSKPGRNAIVFKDRRGLCKLSIETGAQIVPCYVFGSNDFFENLATNESFLSSLCRKYRIGVTIFWGYLGLPIP